MIIVSLATQKTSPVPAHVLDAMNVAAHLGPIPERHLAGTEFGFANEAATIRKALADGEQNG